MRHTRYRQGWWTKERVIAGLKRFYRDFKVAPTSTQAWQDCTIGTGVKTGIGNPYPSFYGVLKYFRTFREAWTAIGVKVNRIHEDWTAEEDWIITEGAGIFTRNELAELVNRSPDAVHRRLYDLGINTRTARGWTAKRIEKATGVPFWTIKRYYMDAGKLPHLRGTQCWYIDPADILLIKEIDWNNVSKELAEAVRHALMKRLISVLKGRK